ncbi:Carbonic anhydrase 4 [Orchesella cincta]|uniref:Carbonic anhydrase 4 n=1 Tax=Orchesella cincta TaxID=48709 RepID=A0A1D2MX30_ORCCI|nr:Carbonic anhydrase 4 [Orchesella cincta]
MIYQHATFFFILLTLTSVHTHHSSYFGKIELDDFDKDVLATIAHFKRSNLKHHMKKRSVENALEAEIANELQQQDKNLTWQSFLVERRRKRAGAPDNSSATSLSTSHSDAPTKLMNPLKDAKIEMRYLVEPEILDPVLKHYTMYDEFGFYPPWTYLGFSSPPEWHLVSILYFIRPSRLNTNVSFNALDIRRHRSSMHFCSPEVISVLHGNQTCQNLIKSECISAYPSPINIITSHAYEDESLNEFNFINFDTFYGFDMYFPEDGTDLLFMKLLAPKNANLKKPTINKGSLATGVDLVLDRMIFHLGENRFNGSEHLVDGKQYAMEIEFYFTTNGVPYWEALAQDKVRDPTDPKIGKNVHVLSVMVQAADYNAKVPPSGADFSKVMPLLGEAARMFWDSKNKGKFRAVQVKRKLVSMSAFFNVPISGGYYTYDGSMSHPPCLTGVGRTIYPKPIWITYDTWLAFVFIHSEFSDSQFIAGNYRPTEYILVDADQPTLEEMLKIEDIPSDLGRIVKYGNSHVTVRKYIDYQKYFSISVRKYKQVNRKGGDDQYDYFEKVLEENNGDSGSLILSHLIYSVVFLALLILH